MIAVEDDQEVRLQRRELSRDFGIKPRDLAFRPQPRDQCGKHRRMRHAHCGDDLSHAASPFGLGGRAARR